MCLETNSLGATVTKMEFGVGTDSTSQDGVMGVGFALNEAILQFGLAPYPNLVDQMVSQNLIKSRTYSLYLDDIDASTGVILFGGVDTDKFSGTLSTFPINTSGGVANQFVITLTGLSLSPPSGSTQGIGSSSLFPVNVLLDSGSSFISLPSGMASSLASAMGATFSRQLGGYLLPNCNQQYSTGTLNFFFSGVEISVPYDELIVNPTATDGSTFLYNDGSPACMLGILSGTSDNIAVLGDTFLRSAYVVYDLVTLPSLLNLTNDRIIKRSLLRRQSSMLRQVTSKPSHQAQIKSPPPPSSLARRLSPSARLRQVRSPMVRLPREQAEPSEHPLVQVMDRRLQRVGLDYMDLERVLSWD